MPTHKTGRAPLFFWAREVGMRGFIFAMCLAVMGGCNYPAGTIIVQDAGMCVDAEGCAECVDSAACEPTEGYEECLDVGAELVNWVGVCTNILEGAWGEWDVEWLIEQMQTDAEKFEACSTNSADGGVGPR